MREQGAFGKSEKIQEGEVICVTRARGGVGAAKPRAKPCKGLRPGCGNQRPKPTPHSSYTGVPFPLAFGYPAVCRSDLRSAVCRSACRPFPGSAYRLPVCRPPVQTLWVCRSPRTSPLWGLNDCPVVAPRMKKPRGTDRFLGVHPRARKNPGNPSQGSPGLRPLATP